MASLVQQWGQEVMSDASFFILSILLLLISFLLKQLTKGSKIKLPPSPPKLPILGNLHQLGKIPHRSLRDLSNKYGPLMLINLGFTPTLIVSSAEAAKEICKKHDMTFSNRPQTTGAKALLYGCQDVGFAPYGEYWREAKKICVLQLLSTRRVQLLQFAREEVVADMVDKIHGSCRSKTAVNISGMLQSLSYSLISRVVFGRKYKGEDGKAGFESLARNVMKLLVAFSFGDLYPSLSWLDSVTGLTRSYNKTFSALDALFDQIIKEHQFAKMEDDQNEKEDFIDILLRIQKEGMLDVHLTQDNIKAIMLDMFVAGSDSTTTASEWALAELVKNPTAMMKAQEEVRRVVRKKEKIEENDINKMEYVKCVFKETLRLHPPAPLLVPRETVSSCKVGGYNIPPKTRVLFNAFAIHTDPNSWESPDQFLPERFMNSPADFKSQDFHYIPFGSGRRGCPGAPFACAAVEYVVANLLHWFDWELPDGANPEALDMSEANALSVFRKFPLHLMPVSHFN